MDLVLSIIQVIPSQNFDVFRVVKVFRRTCNLFCVDVVPQFLYKFLNCSFLGDGQVANHTPIHAWSDNDVLWQFLQSLAFKDTLVQPFDQNFQHIFCYADWVEVPARILEQLLNFIIYLECLSRALHAWAMLSFWCWHFYFPFAEI